VKKIFMLILVGIAVGLDQLAGTNGMIRSAVCTGFIISEIISILENAAFFGVEPPAALTKVLEVLKGKDDKDQTGDGGSY
jgi:toxin secretion/phage lysis holin